MPDIDIWRFGVLGGGVAGGTHVLSEMDLAERADRNQDVMMTTAQKHDGMQSDRDAICFIYLREEEEK